MSSSSDRATGGPLTAGEKWGLFWRSFLLQSVWNSKGMQNVGFCFTMMALLKRFKGAAERSDFLGRHLSFFNTNPTLAPYVIGAVAREEASGAEPRAIVEIKRGLGGPLGMAGDALMWSSLRPFGAVLAVALAVHGVLWAAAALLVVYDIPYLVLKARGMGAGAAFGPSAGREVLGSGMRRAVRWLRALTAFMVGLVAAHAVRGSSTPEPWRLAAVCLFFGLAYVAARLRVPVTVIAIGGAIGGVVLMLSVVNGG